MTTDGGLPTYGAALSALALPASATDVVVLANSTTKVVMVKRIRYSITAASAVSVSVQISKLSTLPSGGVATAATTVPYSTINGTASAVLSGYTTLPTLGTHVGALKTDRYTVPVTSTGSAPAVIEHNFATGNMQGLRLGTSEGVAINFSGATSLSTGLMDAAIEWVELPLTA